MQIAEAIDTKKLVGLYTYFYPLLQDEYLGRLANALRVEKTVLAQQMKRLKFHDAQGSGLRAQASGVSEPRALSRVSCLRPPAFA